MTGRMASGLCRDLDLLDVLSSQEAVRGSGLGVSRIAQLCQRQKSQVSRALAGMLEAGLVERDPDTLAYRCGWRLFDLAAATRESHLVHSARPCMERLATSVGRPAYLCALRGYNIAVLLAEPASHNSRGAGKQGVTAPALHTAAGRLLMSEWEEMTARTAFAHTPAVQGMPSAEALLEDLRRIRGAGYAQLDGEFHNGLGGMAAPVRDFTAGVVAAISVPVHPNRSLPGHDAVFRATLRCAAQLSYAMGYSEPSRLARTSILAGSGKCPTQGCRRVMCG
ncbi:IclR family transcriptional regulator [Streptomyces sp. NPDC058466]|uniref:IclR family transcriptional regulator n=1 Tax=Streptomyces sp. NPDC058466 TaxID=3346512 RepID=UPI00366A1D74